MKEELSKCFTHPNINWMRIGDTVFTIYDLNGRCSCGKLYQEHSKYLAENNKRIESVIEKHK